MLLALAGLPGTGKSTLATRIQRDCGAIVLDKDRVLDRGQVLYFFWVSPVMRPAFIIR